METLKFIACIVIGAVAAAALFFAGSALALDPTTANTLLGGDDLISTLAPWLGGIFGVSASTIVVVSKLVPPAVRMVENIFDHNTPPEVRLKKAIDIIEKDKLQIKAAIPVVAPILNAAVQQVILPVVRPVTKALINREVRKLPPTSNRPNLPTF